METPDTFTFCQNDMQSTSFTAFEKMRRKGQFCDLTIKAGTLSITAHRIIVAAAIPYFQSAFDLSDSETKGVALTDNLDPRALESLILFAYTSKVDITPENAQSLLVTAQFLELNQIRDSCIEFLLKRVNNNNVVPICELAISLSNMQLYDNCICYIRKNFDDFSRTDDFLSLPHSCVKEIISDNKLEVSAEEVVFEAIMKWVKYCPSERQVALTELLSEVRLIYLPVPYLIKHVETEELVMNSKSCKDLINDIKNYHLLPLMKENFVNLKTMPRNCVHSLYAICANKAPDVPQLFIVASINNKWVDISSKEVEDFVNNVVYGNGKIFIFLRANALYFDVGNDQWGKLKTDGKVIGGSAVVYHEGKIYCFGSCFSDFMNKMHIFDTNSNEWYETKEMKTKRWKPVATSLEEFIYVTGGRDDKSAINTVEKYCPSKDEWTYLVGMLVKRHGHGCCNLNGKIYVCGGVDVDWNSLNKAEVYDPLVNEWKHISSMESSQCIFSLVPHCGRIYAFGEIGAEMYETDEDEWEILHSLPPMKIVGSVSF